MNRTASLRMYVWNFIKLTRAVFLLGGLVLYGLGVAISVQQGYPFNPWRYVLGQIIVTSTQLMAHYSNEYYDMEADRNNNNRTWFSGGSGILLTGSIQPSAVLAAAVICGVITFLALIPAVFLSPWMGLITILSLAGSWFYSSPPVALMKTGIGEITTSIIVAVLVPLAGMVMQGSRDIYPLILLATPLALLHWAMLVAFEFPDYEADQAAAKTTIAVRLGLPRIAALHGFAILASFFLFALLAVMGNPNAPYLLILLPLGIFQIVQAFTVLRNPTRLRYRLFTLGAVSLFAATSFLALLSSIPK